MLQHNGGRRPIVCNVSWQRFVSNQDFSFLLALSFHFQNFVRLSYSNRASIFSMCILFLTMTPSTFISKQFVWRLKEVLRKLSLMNIAIWLNHHPSDKNEIRHQHFELFMSHVRTYFLAQNNYQHWSFY